jgi:hypothetical protein
MIEVLVVLDLAQQHHRMEQGLARELVNRCVLYVLYLLIQSWRWLWNKLLRNLERIESGSTWQLFENVHARIAAGGWYPHRHPSADMLCFLCSRHALFSRTSACRYQKLRKKAGLTVTDVVELYYAPAAAADSAAAAAADGIPAFLTKIIERQAGYLAEAFGRPLQDLAAKPESSVVIAQELQSIGGDENGASFVAVLAAAPGSSAVAAAAAAAAAGSVQQMSIQ